MKWLVVTSVRPLQDKNEIRKEPLLRLAWNVVRFRQISPAFIVEVKIPKFFLELVGVRNRRFLDS